MFMHVYTKISVCPLLTDVCDILSDHLRCYSASGGGGVLNFELGTDVRPEVSNTTL